MTKLLIPSRNRPTSISGVLGYLARFYPGTHLIIADGSTEKYHKAYQQVISRFSDRLDIDHQVYDPGISIVSRLIMALNSFDDEFVILGADDDFPLLDKLLKGERFLRENPDFSMIMGATVDFRFQETGDIEAKLMCTRPIVQDDIVDRLTFYSKWHYATAYGLVRRAHCITRYSEPEENYLAGFSDYFVGFLDLLGGKIKAMNEVTYLRTRNDSHSFYRRSNPLFYLEEAPKVLALKDVYRDKLVEKANLSVSKAEDIAQNLINAQVGAQTAGSVHGRDGFGHSALFRNLIVRQQYNMFIAMFEQGNPAHKQLSEQLHVVIDTMRKIADCDTDNVGEAKTYDDSLKGSPNGSKS